MKTNEFKPHSSVLETKSRNSVTVLTLTWKFQDAKKLTMQHWISRCISRLICKWAMAEGWALFCGWCWPLTSPAEPARRSTYLLEHCIERQDSLSCPNLAHPSRSRSGYWAVACSSAPPAGQLCAAATSLLEWTRKVGAHSPDIKTSARCAAQPWLRATLDTSSASTALWVRRLWLLRLKDAFSFLFSFFFCLFGFSVTLPFRTRVPPLKNGGTFSVAQRDSAVSDYKPCAEEPPATERVSVGQRYQAGVRRDNRKQRNSCWSFFFLYPARFSDK